MADLTDAGKNHKSAADIKKLEAEIEKGKGHKLSQADAFGSSSGRKVKENQALPSKDKTPTNSRPYAEQGGKNGQSANKPFDKKNK